MKFNLSSFPGEGKEDKTEGNDTDKDVGGKLPSYPVGIEIGRIHQHDGC